MILVVIAPPPGPGEEPPPVDPGTRIETGVATAPLGWTWIAPWLDRTWNLTMLGSPVVKLRGATGTGLMDPTHWWGEAPQVDGSSWEGLRHERRELFIPLMVSAVDTASFLVSHDNFMHSLDPRREGVIRITRPDGTWRELRCRYSAGADLPIDLDPVMAHRAVYGITWAAADPYWYGPQVTLSFGNEDALAGFFPGPPFTIGAGETLANSAVTNPGDTDSYPVWRIMAPFTGFSVGVAGSLVEMTLTKTTGYIDIDMTPRMLTITDEAGVDQWTNVTEVTFAAIPPGVTELTTVINGSGLGSAVQLTYSPRYRRAW